MDYSGEELNRQYRALAALLTGGGTAERRQENGGRRVVRDAVWDENGVPEYNAAVLQGAADEKAVRTEAETVEAFAQNGRDRESAGTLWRTGPFREENEVFGGWNWLPDTGVPADRSDGGTGVPSVRTGRAAEMDAEEITAALDRTAAAVEAVRSDGRDSAGAPEAADGSREPTRTGRRSGSTDAPELAETPETVVRNTRAETAAAESRGTDWGMQGQAAPVSFSGGAEGVGVRAGEIGSRRAPAQTAEAAGARALSLAFQRDARRYDGGFLLY